MSYPTPTVFFLVVFRDDQPGPQHKLFTSGGGLVRFLEDLSRGPDVRNRASGWRGDFDVYQINTATMEVGKYDLAELKKAVWPLLERSA